MSGFKIPSIPLTTCKSIRFPNDIINEVETVIRGKHCSFSAFVVESVSIALKTLAENKEDGAGGKDASAS